MVIQQPQAAPSAQAIQPHRVLVVDPHGTLRTVLAQRLRQDGHLAAAVASAREALRFAKTNPPTC